MHINNQINVVQMEALTNFHSNSDPRNWTSDMEQESREENRLLWELYDQIAQKAKKAGIPVDWVDDNLESVVIGNYEVCQGGFGAYNYKCLSIVPHSHEDMSRFAMFFEEVEEAEALFEAHFNALEEEKVKA